MLNQTRSTVLSPRGRFRLVVCERAPRWAILLRTLEHSWHLIETRSLQLADEALASEAAGGQLIVVAVDDANAAATLGRVAQWTTLDPAPVVLVAKDAMTEAEEWLWREAGAAEVLASPTDVRKVSRILLRLCPAGPESPLDTLRAELTARLPYAPALS